MYVFARNVHCWWACIKSSGGDELIHAQYFSGWELSWGDLGFFFSASTRTVAILPMRPASAGSSARAKFFFPPLKRLCLNQSTFWFGECWNPMGFYHSTFSYLLFIILWIVYIFFCWIGSIDLIFGCFLFSCSTWTARESNLTSIQSSSDS